jgi:hypothetical protein
MEKAFELHNLPLLELMYSSLFEPARRILAFSTCCDGSQSCADSPTEFGLTKVDTS